MWILTWASIFVLTDFIFLAGTMNLHHFGNPYFWSASFSPKKIFLWCTLHLCWPILVLISIQFHGYFLRYMKLFTWFLLCLCFFISSCHASTIDNIIRIYTKFKFITIRGLPLNSKQSFIYEWLNLCRVVLLMGAADGLLQTRLVFVRTYITL